MTTRSALAFACAHLSDERLYAHQLAALRATHDCSVFVFRDHDSMAGMAEQVLEAMPQRFTLIGLSLGGYVAFEVIRRALPRPERLVLIDTTAVADHPARREARYQDIATVQQGGIEALVPGLPARWLLRFCRDKGGGPRNCCSSQKATRLPSCRSSRLVKMPSHRGSGAAPS